MKTIKKLFLLFLAIGLVIPHFAYLMNIVSAAENENVALVQEFIDKGLFNQESANDALFWAVARGHNDVVQALLGNERIMQLINAETANAILYGAAENGQVAVVATFRANPTIRELCGITD